MMEDIGSGIAKERHIETLGWRPDPTSCPLDGRSLYLWVLDLEKGTPTYNPGLCRTWHGRSRF